MMSINTLCFYGRFDSQGEKNSSESINRLLSPDYFLFAHQYFQWKSKTKCTCTLAIGNTDFQHYDDLH